MRMRLNFYAPFLGAGIRVKRLEPGWKEIDVEMKLRWWNANYVGTHYGGSLYSMTDPFFMVMLIENLGKDYIVWDKSASIRFKKPGRGTVFAQFRLSDQQIQEIKQALTSEKKIERVFTVDVKDESGTVIAEVEKLLHSRRKDAAWTVLHALFSSSAGCCHALLDRCTVHNQSEAYGEDAISHIIVCPSGRFDSHTHVSSQRAKAQK